MSDVMAWDLDYDDGYNDWMLPRRFHTARADASVDTPVNQNFQIDPQSLRRRELRKQKLSPQPSARAGREPWSDFDRSIARSCPGFVERMWTLGDTARWVIERTPQAVNGLSIDEEKLFEVLPEIHEALAAGEVSAYANTKGDPVPRQLPAETWSVYVLVVKEQNGLIQVLPLNQGSSSDEQHLLNLRVKRDDVLRTWPDRSISPPVRPTTKGAENQCQRWLIEMMQKSSTRPRPKAEVREEAFQKFPMLAKRGFDRAWDAAVHKTNAQKWRLPGRRF
jgi:hypothetical protein